MLAAMFMCQDCNKDPCEVGYYRESCREGSTKDATCISGNSGIAAAVLVPIIVACCCLVVGCKYVKYKNKVRDDAKDDSFSQTTVEASIAQKGKCTDDGIYTQKRNTPTNDSDETYEASSMDEASTPRSFLPDAREHLSMAQMGGGGWHQAREPSMAHIGFRGMQEPSAPTMPASIVYDMQEASAPTMPMSMVMLEARATRVTQMNDEMYEIRGDAPITKAGSGQAKDSNPPADLHSDGQAELLPCQAELTPHQALQGQAMPRQGEFTTNKGKFTLLQHQFTPDQGEITPNQGEITPLQQQFTPDQGEIMPNQGEITPNQGEITPFQQQFTPDQGEFKLHSQTVNIQQVVLQRWESMNLICTSLAILSEFDPYRFSNTSTIYETLKM
jgi:hypothetical protein